MSSQPINPAWYKGEIIKKSEEIVGDKFNLSITLKFEDPALAQDDRTIDHTFYNAMGKGMGFLVIFQAALASVPVQQLAEGVARGENLDFDSDTLVGKKIQFYVKNELYQGRQMNRVETFLPYTAEPAI